MTDMTSATTVYATTERRDLRPLSDMPPRVFDTARLRLRAVEPDDAELLFALYASDPVTTRYMSFKCTGNIEDTRQFVAGASGVWAGVSSHITEYVWVIEQKANGIPMGSVGIGPDSLFSLGGGYVLGRDFWRAGYAAEAWGCVVDWGKSHPGVYRISAVHDVDNPASGRVMQKVGMSFEGILRRQMICPNVSAEPRDAVMYAWARE